MNKQNHSTTKSSKKQQICKKEGAGSVFHSGKENFPGGDFVGGFPDYQILLELFDVLTALEPSPEKDAHPRPQTYGITGISAPENTRNIVRPSIAAVDSHHDVGDLPPRAFDSLKI